MFRIRKRLDDEYSEEKIDENFQNFYKHTIGLFEQKVQADKDRAFQLWNHVADMIPHLNERVNYWESRRTQFLKIALAVFGANFAGLIALFAVFEEVPQAPWIAFLSFCLTLIICSLRIIWIWNSGNNPPYAFTKAYRAWLWHYRHAEKDPMETKPRLICKHFESEVDKFGENLVDFKKRILTSSEADLFDQDITQLYILITNEKQKVKMVSRLRSALAISFFVAVALGIITGIGFWIIGLNC